MALTIGNTHVTSVFVGSTPVREVYVGSKLVWSATVQITLGTGFEARDQLRAALTARGLNYQTVTEIPFEIELVGSGSIQEMFRHCSALRTAPAMDTSNVTSMMRMFHSCYALTSVPDMDTSQVTDMSFTFYYCQSLTDGNVRLMGRNQNVYTSNMIDGSSLTREPWYRADGTPLEVVQIPTGSFNTARNAFRDALTARGLDYRTVTEVPFDIEFVGTGSASSVFYGCSELTRAPAMNTSQVTSMGSMFYNCSSLTYVPDMDTSNVTDVNSMFYGCSALTDGSVRLMGKHPDIRDLNLIFNSGLTYEPWHTVGVPPDGVHEVSVTDVRGSDTDHPLVLAVPRAGETWRVRIQGTITKATSTSGRQPMVNIGGETVGPFWQGDKVDYSGTVTSANSTIAIRTAVISSGSQVSFVGTVTIET